MARRKGSKNKKQSEPTLRIQGNVPVEVAKAFRIACAAENRTHSAVLTELVQQWTNQIVGTYGRVE